MHHFTVLIGIEPQTLPPVGLLTPSLGNSQNVIKEALSTEAYPPVLPEAAVSWFSLTCPFKSSPLRLCHASLF